MSPGDNKADQGEIETALGQPVGVYMAFKMVDAGQGQATGQTDSLGGIDSRKQ